MPERMPLAGLILNRVHTSPAGTAAAPPGAWPQPETPGDARPPGGARAAATAGTSSAAAALRLHAERMNLGTRERG